MNFEKLQKCLQNYKIQQNPTAVTWRINFSTSFIHYSYHSLCLLISSEYRHSVLPEDREIVDSIATLVYAVFKILAKLDLTIDHSIV